MTEETNKPRRILPWISLAVGVSLIAIAVAAAFYLRSSAFRERVRRELIAELERATGGRVELKGLAWNFSHLQFDIDDLTIHGREKPGEIPYAHFDRAHVDLKIVSLLRREFSLHTLDIEHPVVHLIVYSDGSTNQPAPKGAESSGSRGASLFELRMDRLRITRGLLLFNDKHLAVDVNADDVNAGMTYAGHPAPSYSGQIQTRRVELRYAGEVQNGTCLSPAASRVSTTPVSAGPECNTTIVSQAETTFTIHKNEVEIRSLRWSSGKSAMELSGTVTDFRNPHIQAKYKGTLELDALGKLLGEPEMRDGTVDLDGSFRYVSTEDFFGSGKLVLRNGAYSAAGFRVAGVDANAEYSVDVDRITLTKASGHALGGDFSGGASMLHWARITPKSGISAGRPKPPRFKPQEGSIQLMLAGIPLVQGLRALLPPKNPLNLLRVASNVDGKLGIRWTGSPAFAQIVLDANTQAPPVVAASELPLTGSLQATYYAREDRIDVAGVNLAVRATRISASGAIGTQAQLRVSLNTTDLSELAPLMKALGSGEGPLPAIVHGQASFNGTVTGKLMSPNLSGHLQATDFDTVLSSGIVHFGNPAQAAAGTTRLRPIHWDSLVANISYSPSTASARNVVLKRGRAQITGWENAGLIDGQLEPTSPVQVQMAARNTDFADLQQLLNIDYPVSGTFNGQMTLNGTRENLNAIGHLQLTAGAIYGEPYRSFAADVQFRGDEVALRSISLLQDGGRLSGDASYTFDSEQFLFNVSGNGFDLAHIARLQGKKITFGGHADFTASGSGTIYQPAFTARLSVTKLTFSGEAAGDLVATATTSGRILHVEAHTNTQIASVNLNGDVQLQGDLPAEAHIDLVKLDFDPLLRAYLPAGLTARSSISGKFLLRGPLKRPRDIVITADVDQFSADIQDLKLRNEGPLRFSLGNQVASIQKLHIVGPDTDITGTGKVDLAGAGHVDLHGDGHVNLAVVHTFNPGISSSGRMTFTVNAIGKLSDPSLSGNVQIASGAMALTDLPNGLSEINGTLTFDTNRLRVQKLTAKTGGGDLVLGGYVTYSNGLFFDLTATGRDVRIRYPEGVSSQGTADLRLVGTLQNSVLSGDVTVTKFGLTPQFDLAAYVERAKQPPTPPNPNSLVDNVRLDVHIVSTPELRLETSMARVSGDVDIRVRGTAARPSVLGRVSIAEGDITFNSTTYHLERGDIVFANPVRIEPVVNLEASARVRDYDITLGFHGTPDKLNVTYRSEPPLPSADIIALLAFGRTRQESEIQAEQGSQAASQQSFAQTASNAILGEALNSAVSSRVQKLFGISRIKIDPNLGGTEDNPNARLTIEQQVSKDVTVTYLTNLGQYPEQVLQVEYNINKNISLVAVRDYTGVLAIDFRIRQRKR